MPQRSSAWLRFGGAASAGLRSHCASGPRAVAGVVGATGLHNHLQLALHHRHGQLAWCGEDHELLQVGSLTLEGVRLVAWVVSERYEESQPFQ